MALASHPRARAIAACAAAIAGGTLGLPEGGSAQGTGTVEAQGIRRAIDSIAPAVGHSGTPVVVASGDMPSLTAIRIGLGAAGAGFEELTDLVTDEGGAFSVTVRVPAWAAMDRVHRFIVFDVYFRPIALSAPFHVTDADGRVLRQGRVVETEGGCRRFVDADEIVYALEGPVDLLPAQGEPTHVMGVVRVGSTCGAPFTLLLAPR